MALSKLILDLQALGAGAVVRQWLLHREFDGNDFADLAGGVTNALLQNLPVSVWADRGAMVTADSGGEVTNETVVEIAPVVSDTARRAAVESSWQFEYATHMIVGRRWVDDASDSWRTDDARSKLAQLAIHEFRHASARAAHADDTERVIQAEVAIVGGYLLVPSLDDVRKTLRNVLRVATRAQSFDTYRAVSSLAEQYRALPADASLPLPLTSREFQWSPTPVQLSPEAIRAGLRSKRPTEPESGTVPRRPSNGARPRKRRNS